MVDEDKKIQLIYISLTLKFYDQYQNFQKLNCKHILILLLKTSQ